MKNIAACVLAFIITACLACNSITGGNEDTKNKFDPKDFYVESVEITGVEYSTFMGTEYVNIKATLRNTSQVVLTYVGISVEIKTLTDIVIGTDKSNPGYDEYLNPGDGIIIEKKVIYLMGQVLIRFPRYLFNHSLIKAWGNPLYGN